MAWKPLFVPTLAAVDRAAKAYAADGRGETPADDQHWETMYGPHGDAPTDFGMLDWGTDKYDYSEC